LPFTSNSPDQIVLWNELMSTPNEGASPDAGKPMSPLEKIRAAKKAAEAAGSKPAAPAESKSDPTGEGGAAKPMSPIEKLRAAAAKKAAGDESAAKPEPAAAPKAEAKEKPAAKEKAVKNVPPAGERPKPTKPTDADAAAPSRRFFLLTWIGAAWASFTAGCSAAVLAGVRFMYPNVLQEPPTLFKIGSPDRFEEGNVYETWKADQGVWVVKSNGELFAIRTVCTHLGCTPNWLEAEQKFKCPCHGSGFRKTGINFEGPAPRPLERFAIMVADDGQVMIDKSKKLQQELGQWTPENSAFIKV
jgi:cytochrome b6-f complex iron-sulfur subunit